MLEEIKNPASLEYEFAEFDGVDAVAVYYGGMAHLEKVNHLLEWRLDESGEKILRPFKVLTLDEMREQLMTAEAHIDGHDILTVVEHGPLKSRWYQYGNYGDSWWFIGETAGYA